MAYTWQVQQYSDEALRAIEDQASGLRWQEANRLGKEVFFQRKCGKEDTANQFWKWCMDLRQNTSVRTRCDGLLGSSGRCDVWLKTAGSRMVDLNEWCWFGPIKFTNRTYLIEMTASEEADVKDFCFEVVYGPKPLPLWLTILIVLLILLAVCAAGFLFWKFYLKRRMDRGSQGVVSNFTSAVPSTTRSALPSGQGPGGLLSGSSIRKVPTLRSALTSSSYRTSSGGRSGSMPSAVTINSARGSAPSAALVHHSRSRSASRK